ncbi:MAG: peptidase, partial [Nitrosopumilaceae archaeon]
SGQANLNIKILAENTGSNDNVVLMCTGPAICNYDVWNGEKAFKYSSTDFTSGQIALKPGDSKEINLFFGPNIGYGGTKFEYDSTKDYYFRISEPWGSEKIPLNLK